MAGRAFTIVAALVISLSACTAFDEPTQGPSPSPLPAADGTNLAACSDAACEVEVREEDEVRLDSGWRVTAIEVEYLSEEKITLWVKGLTGPGHLEGIDTDVTGAEGHLSVRNGQPGRVNEIELTMVPGDSARAVLTMRPV